MKTIMANYMFKNTGDQNGDGFVSKHEYHTAMMCLGMGPDLTERYMNEDFAKYDADGDEQMNFEEFKVRFTLIKCRHPVRNIVVSFPNCTFPDMKCRTEFCPKKVVTAMIKLILKSSLKTINTKKKA